MGYKEYGPVDSKDNTESSPSGALGGKDLSVLKVPAHVKEGILSWLASSKEGRTQHIGLVRAHVTIRQITEAKAPDHDPSGDSVDQIEEEEGNDPGCASNNNDLTAWPPLYEQTSGYLWEITQVMSTLPNISVITFPDPWTLDIVMVRVPRDKEWIAGQSGGRYIPPMQKIPPAKKNQPAFQELTENLHRLRVRWLPRPKTKPKLPDDTIRRANTMLARTIIEKSRSSLEVLLWEDMDPDPSPLELNIHVPRLKTVAITWPPPENGLPTNAPMLKFGISMICSMPHLTSLSLTQIDPEWANQLGMASKSLKTLHIRATYSRGKDMVANVLTQLKSLERLDLGWIEYDALEFIAGKALCGLAQLRLLSLEVAPPQSDGLTQGSWIDMQGQLCESTRLKFPACLSGLASLEHLEELHIKTVASPIRSVPKDPVVWSTDVCQLRKDAWFMSLRQALGGLTSLRRLLISNIDCPRAPGMAFGDDHLVERTRFLDESDRRAYTALLRDDLRQQPASVYLFDVLRRVARHVAAADLILRILPGLEAIIVNGTRMTVRANPEPETAGGYPCAYPILPKPPRF